MPKGVPNKRYTPEFKKMVIETMLEEKLSYRETARQFEVSSDTRIKDRERIYLTEGPEVFSIERRVRSSIGSEDVEEDLLAEAQRLRAENDYLKTCKSWFWKTSNTGAKNSGTSKVEAETRSKYTSLTCAAVIW